jgi:hypothetical protein
MILDFADDLGKRHFEFCFVGFVLGGSLQDKKGMQLLRAEVGIFEKLESVSEPKPCGKKLVNGEPERQLKAEGGRQMQLSVQEYDILVSYLAQVPWQSGTPVRHAVETIDWLDAAQRASRG